MPSNKRKTTPHFREGEKLSIHQTFIESQNHRMVGVGRDLCGSSSPTLLPEQGHLQ